MKSDGLEWCPVHLCWENPEEWMSCDDDLHRRGCNLYAPGIIRDAHGRVIGVLGGVPMQVESAGEFELTI